MNLSFRLDTTNTLYFTAGYPEDFAGYRIPDARSSFARGEWGAVCVQEMKTGPFLFRHFLFLVKETLSFFIREQNEGVQSLLTLKGELRYQVKGQVPQVIQECEYVFLNAGAAETLATVPGGKLCSVVNTYYPPAVYEHLSSLLPQVKKKPGLRGFFFPPRVARFTALDTIQAIWQDLYVPALWETLLTHRIETTLYTLLAQAYTAQPETWVSLLEREMAAKARELLLKDVRKHLKAEDIAGKLVVTSSWLKKAFRKVYGMGMYHYLRRERMERAREMLIEGDSLKAASLAVGMRPQNFPKEFKTFFGYTVSDLKKGL